MQKALSPSATRPPQRHPETDFRTSFWSAVSSTLLQDLSKTNEDGVANAFPTQRPDNKFKKQKNLKRLHLQQSVFHRIVDGECWCGRSSVLANCESGVSTTIKDNRKGAWGSRGDNTTFGT